MSEDDAFREEVEVSLRQATDGQLVRIMQFIERLPSRGQLDDVIAPMRGRLAMVRPVRSLTLGRVLTLPVEDLLVDVAHAGMSPWVLPRDILTVFHDIALRSLAPADSDRLEQLAAGATMDDREIILEMGQQLWPMAAGALRQFLIAERRGEAVLPPGFRANHRVCLEGIADILDQAEVVVDCLGRLPARPMPDLTTDEEAVARQLLMAAGAVSPALLRYALAMLMRRAATPGTVLTLWLDSAAALDPLPVANVAAECASECLIEIELLCAELLDQEEAGGNAGFPDDGRCGVRVAFFADRAARIGVLNEAMAALPPTIAVDRPRLLALQDKAAQTLLGSYERALAGPMRRAFAQVVRPQGAENGGSADPVAAADAEAIARALARIQDAGAGLGLEEAMATLRDQEVGSYRLSIAYRAAADPKQPGERIIGVMDGLRLVEILAGPAVAEAMIDEIVTTA